MSPKQTAILIVQFLPLALIYSFIAFAERFGVPLLLALVLAIIVVRPDFRRFDQQNLVFLALLLQYPILHLLKITVLDPSELRGAGGTSTHHDMWINSAVFIVFMALYLTRLSNLRRWIYLSAPFVFYAVLGAQAFQYFVQGLCRVPLWTHVLFTGPLFLTMLTLLWFASHKRPNAIIAIAMIAGCLISSVTFAGTRGIFLAQLGAFGGLFVVLLWTRNLALAKSLFIGVFAGLAAAFAIDLSFSCGFTARISVVTQSAETITSSTQFSSANTRIAMWRNSLELIRTAPILGHGIGAEVTPAGEGFFHVHNMYLSWLIWGGFVSLLSGLAFMFAVCSAFLGKRGLTPATLFVVTMPVFFGLTLVFDSFFVGADFTYAFIAFTMLGYAVATRMSAAS